MPYALPSRSSREGTTRHEPRSSRTTVRLPDLYAALFSRWRRRFAFSSRLISAANSGLAGS